MGLLGMVLTFRFSLRLLAGIRANLESWATAYISIAILPPGFS